MFSTIVKKIYLILFVVSFFIIISISNAGSSIFYDIKNYLVSSRLLEIYIHFFRDESVFDNEHVITKLDNGMPIIVNKNDRCVCWLTRITGHWDSNERDVLNKIVHNGFKVIEVGSNFGVNTLQMAQLVGKHGKVYAFEANPNVSKYLKKTIELNNLTDVVDLYEKAAGDSNVVGYMRTCEKNIGGSHMVASSESYSVQTEIVCLDDVIESTKIDLLKIDAEGYEFKILQGAKKLINENIDNIILMLEFVPSHLDNNGTGSKDLINFLKSKNFLLWRVGKKKKGEPNLVSITYDDLSDISAADILASRNNLIIN